MSLRELIYSQQDDVHGSDSPSTEEQQPIHAPQGLEVANGLLEAAMWRQRSRDTPRSCRWRGLRPSRRAPLCHWPTSILPDCQDKPVLLHTVLLQRLLTLFVAARDVAAVATTLGLLHALQPRLEDTSFEGNLWLLTELAAREAGDTPYSGRDDTNDAEAGARRRLPPAQGPRARRLLLFLRTMMSARIQLPEAADVENGHKTIAPPNTLRILALAKLVNFLVEGGRLSEAREALQQESFLRPFAASPYLRSMKALFACLEAGLSDGGGGDGGRGRSFFNDLAAAPSRCFAPGPPQRGSPASLRRAQAALEEILRAMDAGKDLQSGLLATSLAMLRMGGGQRRRERVCNLVLARCQRHPDSPRAQEIAHSASLLARGQDHKGTLRHLKRWQALDPSSDRALAGLLHAYRRQLLRSYRDPKSPVLLSRPRLTRALIDRLLTLPPPLGPPSLGPSPLSPHLRYFRLLAAYLGPLKPHRPGGLHREGPGRAPVRLHWGDRGALESALAGAYEAWSPGCRGAEGSALELFNVADLGPCPRERAFSYQWDRVLGEDGWPRSRRGGEMERMWALVKFSPLGLQDKDEEADADEEGEAAREGRRERSSQGIYREGGDGDRDSEEEEEEEEEGGGNQDEGPDADDMLLRECTAGDEGDGPVPEGVEEETAAVVREPLLLLAYKAGVAAHLMGPRNPYTVTAIRRLWELTQPGPFLAKGRAPRPARAPLTGRWLFGRLREALGLDVAGILRLSDAHILARARVQPPRSLLIPPDAAGAEAGALSLGLAAAASGWPLPDSFPPRAGRAARAFLAERVPGPTARASGASLWRAFRKAQRSREPEQGGRGGKKGGGGRGARGKARKRGKKAGRDAGKRDGGGCAVEEDDGGEADQEGDGGEGRGSRDGEGEGGPGKKMKGAEEG